MVSIHWLDQHKPHWDRLEHLVRLSKDGLAKLSHQELQELGLLYRQTASDLSVVMEDTSSTQLAAYLKQLLGRSHNLIYMGYRPKAGGIVSFYLNTYPRVFRETLPLTLVAIAIFAAGAIAGWAATVHDPGFAYRLLGPQMMETIERHEMWTHSVVAVKPVAASAITTNNLTVAFTMFASGITVIGPILLSPVQRIASRRGGRRDVARGHGDVAVEFRRATRSRWSCPRSLSPAAPDWISREDCCFRECCRGASR